MQIGIFSNGNRNNKIAKQSYDEDLKEIIVADRLGMTEAWISEHGTFLAFQAPDQLPCADLLICKAAGRTQQIKMGPGIRPVPFFHPLQLATDAAVCDHLTGGRYLAGFGVGCHVDGRHGGGRAGSDRTRGLVDRQRDRILAEALLRDEGFGGVDQLLEVFDAIGAFLLGAVEIDQSGGFEHVFDGEFDVARFRFEIQRVAQHHCRRRNRAAGIRAALAGDVWSRAMHRLIKPNLAADGGRGQHAQRTGNDRGFVGKNVAEEVLRQ